MQALADFVRNRGRGPGMSPVEMDRRAREVVDAIDAETGTRTAHAARVQRLYALGCDIQHAKAMRAQLVTVHKIIAFLMEVLVSNYGLGYAR